MRIKSVGSGRLGLALLLSVLTVAGATAQELPLLGDAIAALTEQAGDVEEVRVIVGRPAYQQDGEDVAVALRQELLSHLLSGDTATWQVVVRPGVDAVSGTLAQVQETELLGGAGARNATHFLLAEAEPYVEGMALHLALVELQSSRIAAASVAVILWTDSSVARARPAGVELSSFSALRDSLQPFARTADQGQSDGGHASRRPPGAVVVTQPAVASMPTNPALERMLQRWLRSLHGGGPGASYQLVVAEEESDLESITRSEARRAAQEDGTVLMSDRVPVDIILLATYSLDPLAGSLELTLQPIDVREERYLPGRSEVNIAVQLVPVSALGASRSVRIGTEPDGVRVLVDGAFVGRSPVRLQGLEPGRYSVTLHGVPPFATLGEEFVVEEGDADLEFSFALPQPTVRLRVVDSATGAPVENAEVIAEETQFVMERPGLWVSAPLQTATAKTLQVAVRSEEYFPENVAIDVNPSQPAVIDADVSLTNRREVPISILSEPPRAAVFLDNRFVGQTPLTGLAYEPRDREVAVRLVSGGFEPYEQTLALEDLTGTPLTVALTKRIMIRSRPAGAILLVDDQEVGRTDMEILLPARDTSVAVRLGSYTETVTLNSAELEGGEVLFEVAPRSREVDLEIRVNVPDPEVWIDGRQAELARDGRVRVAEGPRSIRVLRAGFAPYAELVSVSEGMTLTVFLVPFETRRLMAEARGYLQEEKLDRAYELLQDALEFSDLSPELTVLLMDVCLAGMRDADSRVFGDDVWNEWVSRFEEQRQQTRLDLVGARWEPEFLLRVARYNEHLWDRSQGAAAYFTQSVQLYQWFLDAYRSRATVIGSVGSAQALADAHFARARLIAEARAVLHEPDRPSAGDVRAAIQDYLYLPVTDPREGRRAQAVEWMRALEDER